MTNMQCKKKKRVGLTDFMWARNKILTKKNGPGILDTKSLDKFYK